MKSVRKQVWLDAWKTIGDDRIQSISTTRLSAYDHLMPLFTTFHFGMVRAIQENMKEHVYGIYI